MAIFKNKQLGIVTGRTGDIVFKTRKGTAYIATPALNFHKSMSEASVTAREVFKVTNKLYSALGKIYQIKQIWNEFPISNGTFINKMQIVNKGRLKDVKEINSLAFVPFEELFVIELDNAVLNDDDLVVTIRKTGASSSFGKDAKCSLQGVVKYIEHSKSEDKIVFVPAWSEDVLFNETEPMTFTLHLDTRNVSAIKKSEDKSFYVCMIVKLPSGEPAEGSVTIGGVL